MPRENRPSLDGRPEELPQLPEGYQYSSQGTRNLSRAGARVASLLTSLSRSARSLGFYSPNNRALGLFFDKLSAEMTGYLDHHDGLMITVEPTRFLFEGEAVFEDGDRERSLPFRLHRDGIRTLWFRRGIRRDELLTLTRILGVRETGQQLHGEDIVTRLWRAELPHVRYEVVKGFVRESLDAREEDGGGVPGIMRRIHGALAFEGVDPATSVELFIADEEEEAPAWMGGVYPGRVHHEALEVEPPPELPYPVLHQEELDALRAELDGENRNLLIRFLDFLLDLSITQGEILRPEHFLDLVFDGWRKLVAEGDIAELTALVEYISALATSGEHGGETQQVAARILQRFLTHESLRRVVAATPPEGLGPDHLEGYLHALGHQIDRSVALHLLRYEMPDALRETLQEFLAWRTRPEPTWLTAQLHGGEPLDVLTAMDTLALHGGPDEQRELLGLMRHDLADLRLHLLTVMENMPNGDPVRRALGRAVRDDNDEVRTAALRQIALRGDAAAAGPLIAEADRLGILAWPTDQRAPLLRAIAACDPLRMISWVLHSANPDKPWARRTSQERAWADVAIEAMVILGDPAAIDVLRKLKEIGPEEYRRRALKAYLDVNRKLQLERETIDPEGSLL